MEKNKNGEYESHDLLYRRLPVIYDYYHGKIKKMLCSWIAFNGTVLDFGCGQQKLKHILPKDLKYIGYDVIPGYSDIKDYKSVNPSIVFMSNVIEHLSSEEMNGVLKYFKEKKVDQILVNFNIKDSWFLWWLTGVKRKVIKEHCLENQYRHWGYFNTKLSEYFKLHREFKYHTQLLSDWRKKEIL